MRDNRICNFDFINAQMEHSKLEDLPSAVIADHTGFLDLGGTRTMTGGLLATGTTDGYTIPSGAGTRMMYVPSKDGAFRVGSVNPAVPDAWDSGNIGNGSFATGGVIASGSFSTAFGSGSGAIASGSRSVHLGLSGTASGSNAIHTGNNNLADCYAVMALGRFSTATGGNLTTWVDTDPILVVGNGTGTGSRSTALTIYKDGAVTSIGTGSFGDLGIGTSSPDRPLEIRNASPVIRLRATGSYLDAAAPYVEFGGDNAGAWKRTGYVGDAISGDTSIYLRAEVSDLKLGDSTSDSVLTLSGGDVTLAGTGKINFRDTDIFIGSTLTDGILDMTADVSIDMFFDNADRGEGVDGQHLNINRRAAGDDYISLYVDKDRKGLIGFSGDDDLLVLAANALTVNGDITVDAGELGAVLLNSATLKFVKYRIGPDGANIRVDRARGTKTSPDYLLENDVISLFNYRPWGGSGFPTSNAQFGVRALTNHGVFDRSTKFRIDLTPFGSTTVQVALDLTTALADFKSADIQTSGNVILDKASGNGIKVDRATPTFGFADLLGDQFSKNTGGTKPTLVAYNGDVDAWQFTNGDEAFLSYHIPHDYVAGTDIHLHIHWSQNAAGATGGTIDFKYFAIYAKGHNQASGSTFTSTPITATFSSIDIDDGGSGLNQYQQHFTEVIISGASATAALFDRDDFEPDGVIELTLEMDADNLTGTASSPFIHYADIHYQTTGLIGTKQKAPDFYGDLV